MNLSAFITSQHYIRLLYYSYYIILIVVSLYYISTHQIAETLADPEQHPELFPNFAEALKACQSHLLLSVIFILRLSRSFDVDC